MSVVALQSCNNLKGTVWSVEDFQMFDVGSGDMALEESARASVAQADGLPITDAERGQHQGQHGDDLGIHGVGGRARWRLQGWTAGGHRGGPRVKVRQREARAGRFRSERLVGRGGARQGAGLECGWGL